MPGVRRLAYRDRFVWSLIQTIEGGSGSLPPLTFAPDVETTVLVSWTEQQWERIFSALMNGADLTYPETAHQVVWDLLRFVEYPVAIEQPGMVSAFDVWARLMTSNGAAWTSTDTTFMYFSHCMLSPAPHTTIGRQLFSDMFFTTGDYNASVLYPKTTVSGISELGITVVGSGIVDTILTVDQNGLLNAEFMANGNFTITDAGYYRLVFGNGGSTTSGSYQAGLSSIHIRRI